MTAMNSTKQPANGREPRLLALDGGGVRGLSSLMILKQLMEHINADNPPRPCDYFNLIGGTSTGGLIAIMLGRLRMNVDECIGAYTDLSSKIFNRVKYRSDWHDNVQERFDPKSVARAVKNMLLQRGLTEDALLNETEKEAACKV
jgi:patatin-like phospholipase/acyl hydrolase